eukprot:sb/3465964/
MFLTDETEIETAYVNFTDMGIDPGGVALLKTYNVLILIVGVCGNALVLLGFRDPKVMKIDITSRIILQNLAITDIFYTIFQFFPSLVALSAQRWTFGSTFCLLDQIVATIFAVNEIHCVLMLSAYRVWFIHNPGSPRSLNNARYTRWVVLGVFIHDVLLNTFYHIHPQTITTFVPEVLCCVAKKSEMVLRKILIFYSIVIPVFLTVLLNSLTAGAILRIYCRKKSGSAPYKKATLIITTISLAFLISYIPFVLQMAGILTSPGHRLISMYAVSVNIVLNPFIYALIDREFKVFVRGILVRFLIRLLDCYEWFYWTVNGPSTGTFSSSSSLSGGSFEMVRFNNDHPPALHPPARRLRVNLSHDR